MKTSDFKDLFGQYGFIKNHFAGVYARDMCPVELPVNKFIIVNTE